MTRLMGLMDVHEIPATSVKYKCATRLRHHVLTQVWFAHALALQEGEEERGAACRLPNLAPELLVQRLWQEREQVVLGGGHIVVPVLVRLHGLVDADPAEGCLLSTRPAPHPRS